MNIESKLEILLTNWYIMVNIFTLYLNHDFKMVPVVPTVGFLVENI